jgi:Arc/MetJ-type ribon-helix-helix transcriptional regulator
MMYYHTSKEGITAKAKVAITLESALLGRIDRLVREARFPNRSQAIEVALAEKLERLDRTRLAQECAKLDPRQERALADEGLAIDVAAWPAY